MAIKRVLLPVGGDGSFDPLADVAFFVGEMFSAQVMGLFVQPPELVVPAFDGVVTPEKVRNAVETAQEKRRETAARAQSMFKAIAGRFPHIKSIFSSLTGDVETLFVRNGRLADISVIAPQDSRFWLDVQNATLFRCGRPVLFVPPHARKLNFETVAIAWKDSLEAARAIAAAQPFMARAREIHLFTIDDGGDAVTFLREAKEYLSLHYDEVRSEVLTGESHQIGKLLLGQANGLGALLVMGAFGHWRWQERLLGGVTDYVLREASTPVLMMH